VKNFTLNGYGDLDNVCHAYEFKDYAVARVIFLQMPNKGIKQVTKKDAFLRAAFLLSNANRLTHMHIYTYIC